MFPEIIDARKVIVGRLLVIAFACCSLLGIFPVQATAAPLMGSEIGGEYRVLSFVFNGPITTTVGPGVEFPNDLITTSSSNVGFHIDIDSSSIRLELVETPPTSSSFSMEFFDATFNGIRLFDVNNTIDAFSSVTFDLGQTTVPGIIDNSRIAFTNDEILINLAGLTFTTGLGLDAPGTALIVLNLTLNSPPPPDPTPIPEPASLALWGVASLGVAGYCGWRRRKRPQPAA